MDFHNLFLQSTFNSLCSRMIQNMNEATKSNGMFLQVQEIKETVRLAFLNCFLDFAGMLDHHHSKFHFGILFFLLASPCTSSSWILFSACHSGYLERMGSEQSLNRSNKETTNLQNGHLLEPESKTFHPASGVFDSHQKLLMILSNIGFCKDQLSHELYNKYKHIWLQSRYCRESSTAPFPLVFLFSSF